MFTRSAQLPDETFFLFGPRGTGKTTWLNQVLPNAHRFDLLSAAVYLPFLRDPSAFSREVAALPAGSWVVVDEVQKVPALLDEVQRTLASSAGVRFALTGSSARKLKRHEANLLAGRALTRRFFPLTARELGDGFVLQDALSYGMLPRLHVDAPARSLRIDRLEAYVDTYLREEIQQETRLRNVASFTRFLEVAAICNAQVINTSNIARDAGVARQTVQGYFDVLVDTLLGTFLPAWAKAARVKQTGHPKFFFFDTGVVRALSGALHDPPDAIERGRLFETWLLHELRAYCEHDRVGGNFFYWGTPSGREVDFIWARGKRAIGFEAKSSDRWDRKHSAALQALVSEKHLSSAYGIYCGDKTFRDGDIAVLPWRDFLKRLYAGEIFPTE